MRLADLALFGAAVLVMTAWGTQPIAEIALVGRWGQALGAAPTIFQTASIRAAGQATDPAQGLFVTVWNSGVAIGGLAGGALLAVAGVSSLPSGAIALFVPALIVSYRASSHGFPASAPARVAKA